MRLEATGKGHGTCNQHDDVRVGNGFLPERCLRYLSGYRAVSYYHGQRRFSFDRGIQSSITEIHLQQPHDA